MKFVMVAAVGAMLSTAGLSGAAAAASAGAHTGDNWGRSVVWPDMGPPRFASQRIARATINDADEDYEARSRRAFQTDDSDSRQFTRGRNSRAAKRSRRARNATRQASPQRASRTAARTDVRSRRARRANETSRSGPGGREIHGVASYYWQGQRVATGARFNPEGLTAAHRTLPFGTRVRVTHLGNGRSVNVVINDRGPFIAGRVIDLARGAARVIGMTGQGLARVRVTVLGR